MLLRSSRDGRGLMYRLRTAGVGPGQRQLSTGRAASIVGQ